MSKKIKKILNKLNEETGVALKEEQVSSSYAGVKGAEKSAFEKIPESLKTMYKEYRTSGGKGDFYDFLDSLGIYIQNKIPGLTGAKLVQVKK
jgi:hypothetical protein